MAALRSPRIGSAKDKMGVTGAKKTKQEFLISAAVRRGVDHKHWLAWAAVLSYLKGISLGSAEIAQ
jgi:hypothetical protein